jgi:hypothetical protein
VTCQLIVPAALKVRQEEYSLQHSSIVFESTVKILRNLCHYSGLLDFWTLAIVRYSKHDVSETGSVSVLRSRGGDIYCAGSVRKS